MHNVDVRNVSLGQIMYFIKVAESMNISETAEFFHLTQPVLSKKIASLERQLDLQLFIRTNRIAALTPAGKYLYEKWKHIVSHIEEEIQQALILRLGVQLRVGKHFLFRHEHENIGSVFHPFRRNPYTHLSGFLRIRNPSQIISVHQEMIMISGASEDLHP